jgi:hypothetical protein
MLNNYLIPDAPSTLYTSVNTSVIVSGFFCNLHDSPVTITVYVVPNGGTIQDQNIIYKDITIAPDDTYIIDVEKIILDDGEFLAATASVADVVAVTLITMAI